MKETLGTSIETIESEEQTLKDIEHETSEEIEISQRKVDETKKLVQEKFNELRELLDIKEKEILEKIEESQRSGEELNQLVSDTENVLDECQSTLEKGGTIFSEWGSTEITANVVDKAIHVVNEAKEIQRIKRVHANVCGYVTVADFRDFEEETKKIAQFIGSVPEVRVKRVPVTGPKGLRAKDVGPFFAVLKWDKDEEFDDGKYDVSLQKEGEVGDLKPSLECTGNEVTINTLKQNTTYKFRVRAKRGGVASEWSDELVVKTAVSTVENMVSSLREHCNDADICTRALEQLEILGREGIFQFSSFQSRLGLKQTSQLTTE